MRDELRRVLAHYDLGEPTVARRIGRGFVNENWEVQTNQGRYFLKHRHPTLRDYATVQAQHALVAHLRRAGFPAPAILPAASGDTLLRLDGEFYEVQEYIKGVPYDHDRPTHFREAALTLARYHSQVATFTPGALHRPGDLYTPAILRANLANLVESWKLNRDPDLAQIAHRLETHADDLAACFARHGTLPHLVIHGDYYADNLLFDRNCGGDHIVGVVDYDKACWQPRVVELAEVLIYFASARPGHLKHLVYPGFLEWEPFERFLRHYHSIVTVGEDEAQALPDYVRCIWLQIALQRLWEKGPRPPEAPEALREVLALGEWAEANAGRMIEMNKKRIRDT